MAFNQRLFVDAGAQSTSSGGAAITAAQTTITLTSAVGFGAVAAGQQLSVVILDGGNPAFDPANPLATNYEYQPVTSISGNVLTLGGGVRASYANTTPKAYSSGTVGPPAKCPIIAVALLAEDLVASFPAKLYENILGVNTASVTITLPTAPIFRSLVLKGQLATDQASSQSANLQFNGDTSNNYDWILHQVTAVPVISSAAAVLTSSARFATAPTGHGEFTVEVPNYALATLAKGFTCRNTRLDAGLTHETGIGNWRSTAAITSIRLFPAAGNFLAGSAFFLYGEP